MKGHSQITNEHLERLEGPAWSLAYANSLTRREMNTIKDLWKIYGPENGGGEK